VPLAAPSSVSLSLLQPSLNKNLTDVLVKIEREVRDDDYWYSRITRIVQGEETASSIHLGVFIEPFLSYIMEGKKTIESRFSVNRQAPFGAAMKNDILLIKGSGGPIVGLCRVDQAWYYHLDQDSWSDIKNFSDALCIQDPDFWLQKSSASYATLLKIDCVRGIAPLAFPKRDRRGWLVLHKAHVT